MTDEEKKALAFLCDRITSGVVFPSPGRDCLPPLQSEYRAILAADADLTFFRAEVERLRILLGEFQAGDVTEDLSLALNESTRLREENERLRDLESWILKHQDDRGRTILDSFIVRRRAGGGK